MTNELTHTNGLAFVNVTQHGLGGQNGTSKLHNKYDHDKGRLQEVLIHRNLQMK